MFFPGRSQILTFPAPLAVWVQTCDLGPDRQVPQTSHWWDKDTVLYRIQSGGVSADISNFSTVAVILHSGNFAALKQGYLVNPSVVGIDLFWKALTSVYPIASTPAEATVTSFWVSSNKLPPGLPVPRVSRTHFLSCSLNDLSRTQIGSCHPCAFKTFYFLHSSLG